MQKHSNNRRRYARRPSFIIAEYTTQEGTFRDVIKNLNAGGLFIKTDRKIKIDQPIVLKFPLFNFDDIIEIRGKIVSARNNGFSVSFENPIDDLICEDGQFPEIVHEADR